MSSRDCGSRGRIAPGSMESGSDCRRLAGTSGPTRGWGWRKHGRLAGLLVSDRDFTDCWSQGRLEPADVKAGIAIPAAVERLLRHGKKMIPWDLNTRLLPVR